MCDNVSYHSIHDEEDYDQTNFCIIISKRTIDIKDVPFVLGLILKDRNMQLRREKISSFSQHLIRFEASTKWNILEIVANISCTERKAWLKH